MKVMTTTRTVGNGSVARGLVVVRVVEDESLWVTLYRERDNVSGNLSVRGMLCSYQEPPQSADQDEQMVIEYSSYSDKLGENILFDIPHHTPNL